MRLFAEKKDIILKKLLDDNNYFRVKIVKGILFGVGTYYKLYLSLEIITEKDQSTNFLRYAALSR